MANVKKNRLYDGNDVYIESNAKEYRISSLNPLIFLCERFLSLWTWLCNLCLIVFSKCIWAVLFSVYMYPLKGSGISLKVIIIKSFWSTIGLLCHGFEIWRVAWWLFVKCFSFGCLCSPQLHLKPLKTTERFSTCSIHFRTCSGNC